MGYFYVNVSVVAVKKITRLIGETLTFIWS